MAHLPDGAPYDLTYGPPEDGLVAIGWLDPDQGFERGPVPPEFTAELRRLCEAGVNRTRGFHACPMCPLPPSPQIPKPRMVASAMGDGEYIVGSAEIRVEGEDGTRYAAPDMIVHYVDAHGYRPPEAFIAAVLRGGPAGPM
jgi:hypothetical protein